MRFAQELVDVSQFDFPANKDLRKPELEMAKTLVKNLEDAERVVRREHGRGTLPK